MKKGKADYLKRGDWNAICDVCGFKYKASELTRRWDNLYVCKEDFELRHPQDFLRAVPDDQSVRWTRPEGPDNFLSPSQPSLSGPVTGVVVGSQYSNTTGIWPYVFSISGLSTIDPTTGIILSVDPTADSAIVTVADALGTADSLDISLNKFSLNFTTAANPVLSRVATAGS